MNSAAQQGLFISAVALMLFGMVFGLAINYAADHRARLALNEAYDPVFALLSEGADAEAVNMRHSRISGTSLRHSRAMDFHTHSINMGILVLLAGLLYPMIPARRAIDAWAITGLAIAAWLYPGGLLLQFFGMRLAGEILAAAGAVLAIITFLMLVIRLYITLGTPAPHPEPGPGTGTG
ncbi:MAG: hypothetical protein HY678_11235 [Chloroflexi bacterium]|nr:hypothetical protein [Chloroflexota bacterium]